jgi:RNA polymerase sigma-70 factor (ECF subfamily)
VEGCQAEDPESQRQLYEQFKDLVYRLVLRMVGREDALDLSQQVFLQVFRSIRQFSGRSQFNTWIYRLAVNECLQFRRRVRRDDCSLEFDPMDESTSTAYRSDDRELLDCALLSIEPDLRVVFLLREVEGLSYTEIAAVLGVSEGTVGSRLNRARSKLQEQLIALGWGP